MFSIIPSLDVQLIDGLLETTGGGKSGNLALVLYIDNTACGIATADFSKKRAKYLYVGVVNAERGKGYGDALTRAMLLRLSAIAYKVTVDEDIPYFKRFGFVSVNGKMELDASALIFPSACKGEHNQ